MESIAGLGQPPDDDAYGRVTNPERFHAVVDAAEELTSELVSRFEVEVESGSHLWPSLRTQSGVISVVRVTPSRADAARLTIAGTAFPGIRILVGRWHGFALPHCGCDACDERVDRLIEELRGSVQAVTSGGFSEGRSGILRPTIEHRLAWDGGARSGSRRVDRATARAFGRAKRIEWAPWTGR